MAFTYKDYADASRRKTLTLTGDEFIRRFRLHLLPPGFTKIRHYGLLGNNRRHQRVPLARAALEASPAALCPQAPPRPATPRLAATRLSPLPGHRRALHRTSRALRQGQPLYPRPAPGPAPALRRQLMNSSVAATHPESALNRRALPRCNGRPRALPQLPPPPAPDPSEALPWPPSRLTTATLNRPGTPAGVKPAWVGSGYRLLLLL